MLDKQHYSELLLEDLQATNLSTAQLFKVWWRLS